MSNSEVANVSPYVAASIIEHVKRRGIAAGFLMGSIMKDGIYVSDYVPYTFVNTNDQHLSAKDYKAEVQRRLAAKQAFGPCTTVGWYTAGVFNNNISASEFLRWCDIPALFFAGKMALHLHCTLPEPNRMSIRWNAYRTRVILEDAKNGKVSCDRTATVDVVVGELSHSASNVFLSHAMSVAMLDGKSPFPSNPLLNLDTVAASMSDRSRQAMEAALVSAQTKMNTAITDAQEVLRSSNSSSSKKKESQEIVDHVEALRRIKEEELERQHNASSREDINTQKFKDALMIKCLAMLLRQQVGQIENLARQYGNNETRHITRD